MIIVYELPAFIVCGTSDPSPNVLNGAASLVAIKAGDHLDTFILVVTECFEILKKIIHLNPHFL